MISTAASNAVVLWPVTQSYFLTRDDPEYRLCHVRPKIIQGKTQISFHLTCILFMALVRSLVNHHQQHLQRFCRCPNIVRKFSHRVTTRLVVTRA